MTRDRDDATETVADANAGDHTEATKREGAHLSERSPPKKKADGYIDRGALVGRYVVLEMLGEGGMGVVYSAFNPELDRKVAIKLLQAKSGGSESAGGHQAWLLREAQALAKLAHPNVVGVHDVGTLPGDRVFVAMELVDGLTLRKWLKAQLRSWREVLPVMRAAGAGLAAAHAAGLVHRDFKPDNVLVGKDGRVRVMDFGLARMRPGGGADTGPVPRPSDLQIEAKSPLTDSLTMIGSVVGTPAYMAPEIYENLGASAATDQFAFGVTLFEALFRSRPFSKDDLSPDRASPPPKPKIPEKTNVPARVQRAVLRAISFDPAQRFPSMDAMLVELAIDPLAGRKRMIIAAGVLTVAAAAFAVSFAVQARGPEPCKGIEQRLAGVWDPATKAKVRAGYVATKRGNAAEMYGHVESALDKYSAQWTLSAVDNCKATRVRRDQTEEVMSLRQACFDQRLQELQSMTTVIAEPDEKLVDKGVKVVSELEALESCSDVAMLRAPGLAPAGLRDKVKELQRHIADAKANIIAGKLLPAMMASQKAIDGATAIDFAPIQAEALLVRGAALASTGNAQDSADIFIQAIKLSLSSHRDDLVAPAALSAAMWVSDAQGKPGEAKIWLLMARQFALRSGQEKSLAQRLDTVDGVIAAELGDYKTAIASHEKAFALSVKTYGADSPEIWNDELLLATTMTKALGYERALPHFEHSIMLRERVVGKDHIDIALMISNAAICYRHTGQIEKARAAFDRTIAMREKLFGKNNPLLVAPFVNYADFLNTEGQSDEALPKAERAVQVSKQLPGVEHPTYHEAATTLAEVYGKLGRDVEARKLFDEVIATETRVKSAVLPITQTARAELELWHGKPAEAVQWAEKAIVGFEAAGGTENPELWRPLFRLGQAKLKLGDKAAAKVALDRSIAIGGNSGMGEYELRELRATIAAF